MNTILPLSRSGSYLLANATIDRAAWRFRHSAPLTFGFQNSGESNAAIQLLSTIQTNPFFPRTACFIALPSQDQDRRVAGYGIGSGAPRQQNPRIPFYQ